MDLKLTGKLAVVTGSASGIGKATARAYLEEGARVVVNGLTQHEVDACIDDLGSLGEVYGFVADLAKTEEAEALVEFALGYGPIDILVNNVGIFSVKLFEEVTDDEWVNYFNINVLSAVRMARCVLPRMLARGEGAIVNLSSEAAVKPLPQMVHYSVTKTAILGLTRGLAELTKGTEVRVNSILPGPTWTEGVQAYFRGLSDKKGEPLESSIENYFKSDEPSSLIQRFIKPEEVAKMIIFISSSMAANGAGYRIEGGIIRSII
jgi:NAD(P)-dependent dehydrogenase (short-subunit alcohol dehydrogenase family)